MGNSMCNNCEHVEPREKIKNKKKKNFPKDKKL